MKKIFLILIMLPLLAFAQPYQSPVGTNSSYTALDSAATFTGTWEQIRSDYAWIIVTVKSNIGSASNGLKIWQSRDGKTFNSVHIFTYTAGDTTTNKYYVPITSAYVKVTYLNDTTAQTSFSLTTVYQKGATLPTTANGRLNVDVSSSALPSGAATSALQDSIWAELTALATPIATISNATTSMDTSLDNIEADADSTVDMVTAIHGDLDTVEEKLDSLDASSTRIESKLDDANAGIDSLDASSTRIEGYVDGVEAKLDSIDASSTRIEGYVDGAEAKLDSLDASSTRIEGKIDNTNTKLDSIEVTVNNIESKVATEAKQDTMEVSLNAIQSAVGTSNSTLDSLEVTANAIQTAVGTTNTKLDSLDASNTRIEGYVDGAEAKLDSLDASSTRVEGLITNSNTKLDSLDASTTRIEGYTDGLETNQTNGAQQTKLTDGTNVVDVEAGAVKKGLYVRLTDGTNVSSLSATGDLEVSGDGGVALATSANQSTSITRADTANARIQEIKLDIENLKIYNAPVTKYVGLTDTVTTRTDTTTFTGTWVEGEIKADDSCEVAIDGSFPAGQTYIITETTAVKLPKWAIATSNKLFVRRYGGAGTVRFYLRLSSY